MSRSDDALSCLSLSFAEDVALAALRIVWDWLLVRNGCLSEKCDCISRGTIQIGHGNLPPSPRIKDITHLLYVRVMWRRRLVWLTVPRSHHLESILKAREGAVSGPNIQTNIQSSNAVQAAWGMIRAKLLQQRGSKIRSKWILAVFLRFGEQSGY